MYQEIQVKYVWVNKFQLYFLLTRWSTYVWTWSCPSKVCYRFPCHRRYWYQPHGGLTVITQHRSKEIILVKLLIKLFQVTYTFVFRLLYTPYVETYSALWFIQDLFLGWMIKDFVRLFCHVTSWRQGKQMSEVIVARLGFKLSVFCAASQALIPFTINVSCSFRTICVIAWNQFGLVRFVVV